MFHRNILWVEKRGYCRCMLQACVVLSPANGYLKIPSQKAHTFTGFLHNPFLQNGKHEMGTFYPQCTPMGCHVEQQL